MSGLGRKDELFRRIESYLITAGFDRTDAKIYVLALIKGKISSSDVSEEFSDIRQSAAVARLKSLAKKGHLEVMPRETGSKRPSSIDFRAINPRIALKERLAHARELPALLERYDEHWEALGENPSKDTEIWVSKSEKVSVRIGASVIDGAKREISIYSHDCSWCRYSEIQTSLQNASVNGVTVTLVANNPEIVQKSIKKIPVSLYSCEEDFGSPFCIVDSEWLMLPVQNGALAKRYSMIRTNDRYLIEHFSKLFGTALKHSSNWGKK